MRRLIHPNATAVLIRNNEPRFQSLDNTIVTLEKAEQELVETTWDEIEHVDDGGSVDEGAFATVWTKFQIEMNGKVRLRVIMAMANASVDLLCSYTNSGQVPTPAGKIRKLDGSF